MTALQILEAIDRWEDEHGRRPQRGYVSLETADTWSGGEGATIFSSSHMFGREALGVTEWYVDPLMHGDDVRFEDGNA